MQYLHIKTPAIYWQKKSSPHWYRVENSTFIFTELKSRQLYISDGPAWEAVQSNRIRHSLRIESRWGHKICDDRTYCLYSDFRHNVYFETIFSLCFFDWMTDFIIQSSDLYCPSNEDLLCHNTHASQTVWMLRQFSKNLRLCIPIKNVLKRYINLRFFLPQYMYRM